MSMIGQEKEATSDSLSAPCDDVKQLRLRHIIGFNGHVPKGLIIHPKEKHMLYPVASDIVIEHITKTADGEQEFLSRHSDTITALDVSPDGRFVASGQKICAGSKAPVILWDFCLRQLLMEWPAHNVKVQAISFLKSSHIFVSLGVDEDGHLTVWGVGQRQPLTNQLAQPQRATAPRCLAASKRNGDKFITAGRGHGRLWTLSSEGRELAFTELRFGPLGRDVTCVEVADYDSTEHQMAFLGNTGGDILLVVNMTNGTMQACVPKKPVPSGITSITYLRMLDASTFNLLVGTGNGKVMNYDVALTYEKGNKVKGTARLAKDTNVWSDEREQRAVTSIAKLGVGNTFYVGTESCQMYVFNLYRWSAQLIRTCCLSPVLTLTFARGTDDLLVTGEFSQVRVFNLHVNAEVRRYFRANRTCTSAVVNHDGTQVFTGWDNGGTVVLGFDPKDLALKDLYRIDSTQKQAVTALALTSESSVLVSGG
ncbi:cilia- and flagella-associated protein 52, partial [Aplysia californica]|uniref:Cilia- and flagella-associated protein 52 n=1 Tax=Aplysia californica TaxID=6500 RepID=A0ABM1A4J2_APLCA